MKSYSSLLVSCAVLCAGWAHAQEAKATAETQAASEARAAAAAQSNRKAQTKGALWSANDSIGAKVVSATGENLGDVVDIVLDRNKSRIAYVIVSYGGILGIGDKHFAVPWQAFGQTADRELSLQIAQDKLKDAPGFDKGTLPNTADPLFHEGIYNFYGAKPYELEQRDATSAQDQSPDGMFDWAGWTKRGDDTNWTRRLDELIGMNIRDSKGDTIAELEDVIVDTREARVAYAVVSYGGTLGFFENTAIIPWNSLRLDLENEVYVTDASSNQLEQAKLSDTEYRKLEDRKYSEALFGTFQTRSYWDEFGYEANADTDTRSAQADTADDSQSSPTHVSGTVASVSSYVGGTTDTQAQRGVRIRVRTDNGAVRTVHFPAGDDMQSEGVSIQRGDKVEITGSDRDNEGRMVFLARELKRDGKTITFKN